MNTRVSRDETASEREWLTQRTPGELVWLSLLAGMRATTEAERRKARRFGRRVRAEMERRSGEAGHGNQE